MNEQLLTITTSAEAASFVISTPLLISDPSMISASTRFFAQPREIRPTRKGLDWETFSGTRTANVTHFKKGASTAPECEDRGVSLSQRSKLQRPSFYFVFLTSCAIKYLRVETFQSHCRHVPKSRHWAGQQTAMAFARRAEMVQANDHRKRHH